MDCEKTCSELTFHHPSIKQQGAVTAFARALLIENVAFVKKNGRAGYQFILIGRFTLSKVNIYTSKLKDRKRTLRHRFI